LCPGETEPNRLLNGGGAARIKFTGLFWVYTVNRPNTAIWKILPTL